MNTSFIEQTASMLSKFEPGFLPYPVFEQIARLVALPIVEFIPLRLKDNKVEVLLIDRDKDDPYWPNMLHTPGTVIRSTDLNQKHINWLAFERILGDELNDTKISSPHYVGSILHQSKRGVEQAQIYWVEVLAKPRTGSFYPIDNLPTSLIDSQLKFITEAVRNYKRRKDL